MQWTKVADIERTVSSYTIQELKTNAEYIFRIYAQNPIGKSDSCETETVSTKSRFSKLIFKDFKETGAIK